MVSISRILLVLASTLVGSFAAADPGPVPDPIWGGSTGDSTTFLGMGLLSNSIDFAQSSLLQPDGKLVMAGTALAVANPTAQYDLAIGRLNASTGTPDTSFGGGDGRLNMNLVPSSEVRISQDVNGFLLVSARQADSSAVLARFSENGTLDPRFDQDGKKFISAGTILDGAQALYTSPIILPQPSGKYLILASSYRPGPPVKLCVGAIRLNSNGSVDPTFAAGEGNLCEAPAYETLNAAVVLDVAVANDGDLLLAGAAYHSGGSAYDMSVLKISTEGIVDTTFGEDGWAYAAFDEGGNLIDGALAIETDVQGRVLIGG